MLRPRTVLSLALLLGLAACQSTPSSSPDTEVGGMDRALAHADEVECVCGSTYADIHGCYYSMCLLGERNPDNPLCTCGALYDSQDGMLQVSYGAGEGPSTGAIVPREEHLYLDNGRSFTAEVFADDGLSIRVRRSNAEEQTIPYSDLAPRTVYRLKKARIGDSDAQGELELATFASDSGLYAHARRHYHKALELDPSLRPEVDAGLASLRQAASAKELEEARAAISDGKRAQARKHLTSILKEFPDEPAAATAATLLAELDDQAKNARTQSTQAEDEAVQKTLRPARASYEKAVGHNRTGLLAGSSQSKALRSYDRALSEGERSQRQIDKARKRNSQNEALIAAATSLETLVLDVILQANMNSASIYLTRRAFQNALGSANSALALDPKNEEVLALRARIEIAAAQSGWFW